MKVVIVGGGSVGLYLAAELAKRGVIGEVREAAPNEELYSTRIVPVVVEPKMIQETTAFEHPRFNGYMGHQRKRTHSIPKAKNIKWK